MKKAIFLVLTVIICQHVLAQREVSKYSIENGYTMSIDRYHFGTDIYLPDSYIGSPFGNENFLPGTIYMNDLIVADNLFLRYNAIEDDIEIKENLTDEDSKIKLMSKDKSIYARINGDLMIYDEAATGYFQVLMMGNNYNLYKKINKLYYPPRVANTSFEKDILATYKDDPLYYIVSKRGDYFELPKTKNKREKYFEGKKEELQKYIDARNLDVLVESDLLVLFRYFDSFNDIKLK